MKIKHYLVEVTDPMFPGILGCEQRFTCSEFNVIAENERYIAIDDHCFTSIHKESKWQHDTRLNKPSISLFSRDSVWGNRITYRLYADKPKRASTIKREIEAEIAKKFGFFLGKIDLSFINDSASEQKANAA
jgi:hypothetical protein